MADSREFAAERDGITAICEWPHAPDDQLLHRCELGDITVGELRALKRAHDEGWEAAEQVERVRIEKEAMLDKATLLSVQNRELGDALRDLVAIIEKAGLNNLANGVQLGPTVWYVKASERIDFAKMVLRETFPDKAREDGNNA